jgi:hypothetical protein
VPRGRRLIAFVVVGLLGVLTPVAYADPPDPTWLAGYWDDADFDTVVDFLASASAVPAPPVNEANPVLASDERVAPADPLVGISVLQTLAFPRAPPIRLWANG